MGANHTCVSEGRDLICDALGIGPPGPDEMLGSTAAIETMPAAGLW